mgnify:CR=1 FL=1
MLFRSKPGNILIDKNNKLFLADFGSAFCLGKGGDNSYGTICYVPPEGVLEADEHGFPADMWAVGCVLIEIVFSNILFFGKQRDDPLEPKKEFKGDLILLHERVLGRYPIGLVERGSERGKALYYPSLILDDNKRRVQRACANEFSLDKERVCPLEKILKPGLFLEVLKGMLTLDPRERITPEEVLEKMQKKGGGK